MLCTTLFLIKSDVKRSSNMDDTRRLQSLVP